MRKITFVSYVEEYLRGVSGQKSISMHKLSSMMKNNPRIRNPLILYAALTNNEDLLNKYTDYKYENVLCNLNNNNYLDKDYEEYEFNKIYHSYLSRVNKYEYENETKKKARDSIITLMKNKKITNYRVYKDLSLNPGNINDYLTNNNPNKVSLTLVKKIYNYVLNY